jgi:hypothetical protein
MTASGRYVLSFFATCLVFGAIFAAAFVYQLGAPVAAEYWVPEIKTVKLFLAGRIVGRKLIVLGGSNALFGLDSTRIETETGIPTVNLAIHAGLSLDYLVVYARPVLRPGDLLVLTLEYSYFESDNANAWWFSSNVMAWEPEYVSTLGPVGAVAFVLSTSTKRVVEGVFSQISRERLRQVYGRRVRDPREVIDQANKNWREGGHQRSTDPYSFLSIDEHGDVQSNIGSFYHDDPETASVPPFPEASAPWRRLDRLARQCKADGIRLFLAWPALPDSAGRYQGQARRNLAQIRRRAEMLGLTTLGDPTEYALDRRYFFNTEYHLNQEGRELRTRTLLSHLVPQLLAEAQTVVGDRSGGLNRRSLPTRQ